MFGLRLFKRLLAFVKAYWFAILYSLCAVIMLLIGAITSHAFDDAVYLQHNLWFYDLNVNPVYYWLQGSYYAFISAVAFTPAILLQSIGIHNVLVEQFFIKLPFILAVVVGGPIVYQIAKCLGASESRGRLAALIWISNPIVFYTAAIHGTGIVIAVVFLMGCLLALLKSKWDLSAVLLGVAVSTYLFPIFAIPIILRFVWNRRGVKRVTSFFLWFTGVVALGELPAIFASLAAGQNFSQGLVISPGNLGTGSAAYPPSYSIYDLFNLINDPSVLTQDQYTVIFILVLGLTSILMALTSRKSFLSDRNLLTYFTFLALGFIVLNPGNSPQFLLAVIPFIIIEAVVWREPLLLGLMSVAAVLDMATLITWGPSDLFGFLSNTNPSLLQYQQTFPSNFTNALGMLYGLCLIGTGLYWLLKRRLRLEAERAAESLATHRSFRETASVHVTSNVAVMVIVSFLALMLVAPVVGHPPTTMRLLDSLNTWQIDGEMTRVNQSTGNITTIYTLPGLTALLSPQTKSLVSASLNTTGLPTTIVSWFALNATFPFNNTVMLSENVEIPGTFSNATVEILTYGSGPSSLVLTLCKGESLTSCLPIVSIPASLAVSTPAPGNADLLEFYVSGVLYSGQYYVELSGTSSTTYYVGGSTFPPPSAGVPPVSVNGVIRPNATLAIVMKGQENLRFVVNGYQVGGPNPEGLISVPGAILTQTTELVENGTGLTASNIPVLTITLPYTSYEDNWETYPANIIIGTFGLGGTVFLWVWVLRKTWPGVPRIQANPNE